MICKMRSWVQDYDSKGLARADNGCGTIEGAYSRAALPP